MAITVPTPGTPILTSWGSAVTTALNQRQIAALASDVSKSASSWSDITGLSLPVATGRSYWLRAMLIWDQSSTSGGIRIGANFPSGTYRALVRYTGETSSSAFISEWDTAADGGSGVTDADATSARLCIIEGRYICGADGTFALRYYRNTTGTAKVQRGSFLELIADA